MVSAEELLRPLETYKRAYSENDRIAGEYFDELIEKSHMDTSENTITIEKYNKKMVIFNNQKKRLSKLVALKVFMIISIILLLIAGVIFLALGIQETVDKGLGIGLMAGLSSLAILLIVLLIIGPRKKIKALKNGISLLSKEIEDLKQEGYAQCRPLNRLLDFDMHLDVMNKTFDSIHFHKTFTPDQYQIFHENYGLEEYNGNDKSTAHVQSGDILGNPFIIETSHLMAMGTYTYTGTLTITYHVRVPNGKGGYTTSLRTQVLHASVTKPKPYYNYEKVLYFGNDIARKLTFSRSPSGMSGKSQKELNSHIKKEYKKITDKARKDLAKGFTPLGNEAFEVLFGALNRNNEVEFRTLFTPLAQQNFVAQIKNKDPFGDDFIFKKDKTINVVRTDHSQYIDYVGNPMDFVDFDYKNARKKFVDFNHNYFKSVYFDLMPILNIPIYQQLAKHNTFEKKYQSNINRYEVESLANLFDKKLLEPENCATEVILKSKFLGKSGSKSDFYKITAYGFTTVSHVALVPTLGGDGLMHPVPVHWLEYIPAEKDSFLNVYKKEQTRDQFVENARSSSYHSFAQKFGGDNHIVFFKGSYGVLSSSDKPIDKSDIDLLV